MDGASGAFAVVSLAIQLFEIVQETSKFVKNISNAPSELISLSGTLDQLGSVLGYVRQLLEQQLLVLRLPGSPIFILEALQNCERGLKQLKEIVKKSKEAPNDYRTKRVWKSLRFVMKKEQIEELQSQLRDAKSDLQFAVSANSWQLQMHHLELTSEIALLNIGTVEKQPQTDTANNATISRVEAKMDCCTVRSKMPSSLDIQQTNRTCYSGMLGSVIIRKTFKRSGHCADNHQKQSWIAMEEDSFMINPSFMRRAFELSFCNSFGQIRRSLNIYPVMMEDNPIFKMCQKGDMDGMQAAFSVGRLSPFVLDNHGRTLLHHAAMYFHSDLCSWLLHLGVNPDTSASYEQTALQRVAISGVCEEYGGDLTSFATPIIDTLRVLSQAQTDFSLADFEEFTRLYSGPPSGVDFLLLHNTNLAGTLDQHGNEKSAFAFATAVSFFGRGSTQWESLIRKLIRGGVNIHGQTRQHSSEPWYGNVPLPTQSILGTPLDELFNHTNTPLEAQTIGNSWLHILASEGVDILAYIEEEIALHAAQQFSTCSTHFNCRRLIFQLGENISVWWDWYLDPKSVAFLVREEYKSLSLMNDVDDYSKYIPDIAQRDTWPWRYPEWDWTQRRCYHMLSEYSDMELNLDRREQLAEDRAARRMARKALGIKTLTQMPGAWPT